MRVVSLTTTFPRYKDDDVGVYVARLLVPLAEKLDELVVIVPSEMNGSEEQYAKNLQVKRVRFWPFGRGSLVMGAGIPANIKENPIRLLQIPFLVCALLLALFRQKHKPDLIQANWISSGLIAWVYKMITGIPYVITVRGTDSKFLKNKFLKVLVGPALRNAAKIISVNESFVELIGQIPGVSSDKIITIANGVSVDDVSDNLKEEFLLKYKLSPQKKYLLFVGTVIPIKQVDLLIKLLAEKALVEFELLLCGRLDEQRYVLELQNLASKLGILDRVHFLGSVPPRLIPAAHNISQALLNASSSEGRPNAVLEALAYGTPAFVSDIPGHREIIRDGENGFIFQVSDLSELAKKIVTVSSDINLRASVTAKAKLGMASSSWQKSADNYMTVFSQIK